MVIKKFSDVVLKQLKPSTTGYTEEGSKGFGISVSAKLHKNFFYRYNFDGVRRTLILGRYKQTDASVGIGLIEARKRFNEAFNMVLSGIDPYTEKAVARAERKRTPFLSDLVDEYIDNLKKNDLRTWKERQRELLKNFVPVFGQLKVTDLKRRDIRQLLEEVAARPNKKNPDNSNVMANRLQSYISALLSYATEKEYIEINCILGMRKVGGREKAKDRNLSFAELKRFWFELDKIKLPAVCRLTLKLILLTGQRPSEVCGINRDEIDGSWWTIPKTRTKNGLYHRVYMPSLALQLLSHPWCQENHYYLHQVRNADKPMTKDVLANMFGAVVDQLSITKLTAHDLRRTQASRLAETGVSQLMIDRIQNRIAGVKGSGSGHVYNRYEYDPEKQQTMTEWGNYLLHVLYPGRMEYPDGYDYNNPEDTGLI